MTHPRIIKHPNAERERDMLGRPVPFFNPGPARLTIGDTGVALGPGKSGTFVHRATTDVPVEAGVPGEWALLDVRDEPVIIRPPTASRCT